MTTATKGAGPAASAESAARWEDFIDILYAPAAVFALRREAGAAAALIIVTLLIAGTFLVVGEAMRPILEAEFDRGMARSAQPVPPEAAERVRSFAAMMGRIAAFVFTPIMIALGAAALWVGGKVLGARQTFGAALMVAAYAHVPRVIENMVNGLQAVMLDPGSLDGIARLSLGPARFLDPDTVSPMLLAFVAPLDLFTLWITALLAIGLAVTGSITRSRAAVAAAFVWMVSLLPRVLGALSQM